jgi:hypothetical protein
LFGDFNSFFVLCDYFVLLIVIFVWRTLKSFAYFVEETRRSGACGAREAGPGTAGRDGD